MADAELFFDLQRKLTSDPVFIAKAGSAMDALTKADKSGDRQATSRAMLDVLRLCEFNTSLLVPFFFPSYPFNKPMTLWTRPHAMAMLTYVPNATVTVCTGRQTGKCIAGDTMLKCRIGGKEEVVTARELFDKAKASS